jgi:circadian clock protein KaiC
MKSTEVGSASDTRQPALTGIDGLDDILAGGLAPGPLCLIEVSSGTGKTPIATQFLMEGTRIETCLYITLSETEEELRESAASHY